MDDDSCGGAQQVSFPDEMSTGPPLMTPPNTGWSGGDFGSLSSSCSSSSSMGMRKDWPNPQYPHHIHPTFPSRELSLTEVTRMSQPPPQVGAGAGGSSLQQNIGQPGIPMQGLPVSVIQQCPQGSNPGMENNGHSHHPSDFGHFVSTMSSVGQTPSGANSYQFREIIETLLGCYMEIGGGVCSEELRNLVEVFICPVFESLNLAKETNDLGSSSSSSSLESSSMAMPSTSSAASASAHLSSSLPTCWSSIASFSNSVGGAGAMYDAQAAGIVMGQECDSLSCPLCYGILIDPVTITCGHSYCKKCLRMESPGQTCRRCKHVLTSGDISQCKTNVLLGSLVEKWWRNELLASRLRIEGNALFEENSVEQALSKYTEALNLAPDDHLTLGSRSHAWLTAGNSEEALLDAEAAIRSCPVWPKSYFRKSAALISLGRFEEGFLSLTVCMYLMKLVAPSPQMKEDPAHTQVINEMINTLHKLFLQPSTGVGSSLKRHNAGEQLQFAPYPNGRRISGSSGRYERRSRGASMRTSVGHDSEYNSDDESDPQPRQLQSSSSHIYSSSAPNHSDFGGAWGWRSSRAQYQANANPHLLSFPGNVKGSNYSASPAVDQLSVRMSRLFGRASQDLKSFESRLNVLKSKTTLRTVDSSLISSNDLECSLCYRLIFQPVSTGCGHTFCRSCLDRCLDHNPACPLCKTSLHNYLASREHPLTEFLVAAIKQYFPTELEERRMQHMEELYSAVPSEGRSSSSPDIPIFVCTMAFPTIPCPLHVFEPRYRLMIRRCMENGSNRFGMCCYLIEQPGGYGEIGTLLHIKDIQYFPDGRSVVDTVGCRRFRVLRKNVVDGYNAASIELVQDQPAEASTIPVLTFLHDKVLIEATEWFKSVGDERRQKIFSHFGQMPAPEDNWLNSTDGPSWTWWLLAILPLETKAQYSILSMLSLQQRLESMLKVLMFCKKNKK